MNENKLLQYRGLLAEIEDLRNRISDLQAEHNVVDKVTGSDADYPYSKKGFQVSGLPDKQLTAVAHLYDLLRAEETAAMEQLVAIELFISTVSDSLVRTMMRHRYIDGMTWEQIGELQGYDRTTVKRKVLKQLK